MKLRIAGAIIGVVLAATACGSGGGSAKPVVQPPVPSPPVVSATPIPSPVVTPTVAPKAVVTPTPVAPKSTPTVTAPTPLRDVADLTRPVHPFVELELKGDPNAYALAFADSGSVNVHYIAAYPKVSTLVSGRLLIGTYISVGCYERGDLVVNDVGHSSDLWYHISLSEGIDGFVSSVFIDRTSGDPSWVVPACPVGFGS